MKMKPTKIRIALGTLGIFLLLVDMSLGKATSLGLLGIFLISTPIFLMLLNAMKVSWHEADELIEKCHTKDDVSEFLRKIDDRDKNSCGY